MSIYVNNGDGERELREIETPRGVVTSVSVNHGDGNGEQTVWSSSNQMALQFDARQLTLDDGDPVPEWDTTPGDLSAVQTETDAQPTYVHDGVGGNPSVQFDGHQYLEVGYFDEDDVLEQPYTWAAVLQHDPTDSYDYIFYGADTDERSFLELTPDNGTRLWSGSTGGIVNDDLGDIIIGVADGENSIIRVVNAHNETDTTVSGDSGNLPHAGLTIGSHSDGSRGYKGLIGELRGYDRRLTDKEQTNLIAELIGKWEPDHEIEDPSEPTGNATWEINYDNWNSAGAIHDWDSSYATLETGVPSTRGDSTLQWRSRFESNHGNSIIKFSDFDLPTVTGQYGMTPECYYEVSVWLPHHSEMPTAENGEYTMRWAFGGLSHSPGDGHSASGDTLGDNGWSTAPMWFTQANDAGNYPSDGHLGIGTNDYTVNEPDPSTWNTVKTTNEFQPDGNWHRWGFYLNMNSWDGTDMDSNGVYRMYLDGELVHERDSVQFTYTEDNMIEYIGSQWNLLRYGGTEAQDFEWYCDAMNIYLGEDIPSEVQHGVERDWW